jgi:signal transduction histidine kinase
MDPVGERRWLGRLTTPFDAALAGSLAVGAGAETWANGGHLATVRVVLAVATALALLPRRRLPVLSAGLIAAGMTLESLVSESPDEIGVLLAVLVSAFSVGAETEVRRAVLGLGLLAVSLTIVIAVDPSDSPSNIPPTLVLFLGLPGGLGVAFRRRDRALVRLALDNEALQRRAQEAVDDERRRMARELHDVVSHAVTLIAVQAEAGQAVLDEDPAAARRTLASIGDTSRDALAELHSLVALLREPDGDETLQGLDRLPALVEGVRAAGVPVHVAETGVRGDLSPAVNQAAYRLVQEALTNALRHSRRPDVVVALSSTPDSLGVRVTSRGPRHQSAYGGTGSGLDGLRQRVLALGGTFEAGPLSDDGYELCAELPRVPR